MLKYVVVGTGRCGTGYAARLLSSAGVPCGHETVFSFDGYDLERAPGLAADASWLAAPFLGDEALEGVQVVHLVRHPQHVIESLVRMRFFTGEVEAYRPYLDFVERHVSGLGCYGTAVEKAAHFYIQWNVRIENWAPERALVRVEDCPGALLEALGIEAGERELFDDRTYNTRGDLREIVSLDSLATEQRSILRQMAQRYGYELDHAPERPVGRKRVFWAYLLIPAVAEEAVSAALGVAMYCGHRRYDRLMVPYLRTDQARNVLARAFLERSRNPDDVLVMLDCDHEHPFDIVERLAAHPAEQGVVGALAFRRSKPHDPLFFKIGDDGRMYPPAEWEAGRTYQCDVVGSGAIAIRRWVFDRLEAAGFGWPYFRYKYPAEHGYNQSEDVFFARCCHAAGVEHYCDTGAEIPHLIRAVADTALYQALQECRPTKRHPGHPGWLRWLRSLRYTFQKEAIE